nr:restriction endonuclease subunit S [Enterococcus faecalis]
MDASLNQKLASVEWGEYSYSDIFELVSSDKLLTKQLLSEKGKYPTFSSDSTNNGIVGYSNIQPSFVCDDNNPIFVIFGDHTRTFNIAQHSFNIMDNVKVLKPKQQYTLSEILFITSSWKKGIKDIGYARHWKFAKETKILLPMKNGKIDFDFMDSFIAELEAERIAELSAYLTVSGLDNYELSVEELKALRDYDSLEWKEFNLEKLFGKSTRGKRLRSLDRISGDLPFVTAGETNTGISAYISNEVEIFKANTVTIDMFGSAKYRNYDYGADDHIAVVHTEKLNKFASLFTTAAIHKASYSGKFSYDKNFYAKDADELVIALPVDCQGVIQYDYMSLIASAIQKLVIKDVVKYTNERIETTKEVVTSHNTNY